MCTYEKSNVKILRNDKILIPVSKYQTTVCILLFQTSINSRLLSERYLDHVPISLNQRNMTETLQSLLWSDRAMEGMSRTYRSNEHYVIGERERERLIPSPRQHKVIARIHSGDEYLGVGKYRVIPSYILSDLKVISRNTFSIQFLFFHVFV